ncbi:MAG: hypothetical protein OEY09_07600 [Gammaproteobacteria bacterium]|nr:hypothetical protein [Gammaproteobacteria bacterium]
MLKSRSIFFSNANGWELLDHIFSTVILGLLVGTSLSIYRDYVERSRVTQAIHMAPIINQHYVEQFNATGKWTVPSTLDDYDLSIDDSESIVDIQFEDSAYTFALKLSQDKPYKLSFRVAEGLRVNWLCGYQKPLTGHRPLVANKTNLPVDYLPLACRGS